MERGHHGADLRVVAFFVIMVILSTINSQNVMKISLDLPNWLGNNYTAVLTIESVCHHYVIHTVSQHL